MTEYAENVFFPLMSIFLEWQRWKRQAYHLSSDGKLLLVELKADLMMGIGHQNFSKIYDKKIRTYFIVLYTHFYTGKP